jgi:signal peptidase II
MTRALLKYLCIGLVLVGGCAADLYSKRLARSALRGKPPLSLVDGFVELGYTENRGMVFGLLNDGGGAGIRAVVLTAVRLAILLAVAAFVVVRRDRPFLYLLPFLLLLIGAAGNVFDNLSGGAVVDFIHIHAGTLLDWPFLFNLADVYLCAGIGLLLVKSLVPGNRREAPRD